MTFWKTFLATLLASIVSGLIVIGIFFLILSIMLSGFSSLFEPKKLVVHDNTVLHMKLDGPIGDYTYADFNPGSLQLTKKFGLMEILDALKLAKEDDHIKGIFLNCDDLDAGMATVKEIRDGLTDFQASGKFVVAYSEMYDKKAYYLASVANELYVFPTGMLEFLGLGAELMFIKGTLDKLDIRMQIIRGSNNKFKSAIEPLIYTEMSEESRLQTQTYLNALWHEMLTAISTSRGVGIERLNEIADSVYVRQSGDAVEYQMADGIKYYDEVLALLKEKAGTHEGKELELLDFQDYALKKTKQDRALRILEKKNIAVIFAEGDIVDGKGEVNQIGGNTMAEYIREARTDSTIRAVVLRVNSPGGSALASDVIWREVVLTKAVKPIIVSMGDVAASGGYYIACGANKIYAEPNTITGSIGVFGIIPYTGDMFKNKLGITFDHVETNPHAILSTNRELTEAELLIFQEGVDAIYDDFLAKVAEGRGLTKAGVDSIGQGRVWAGTDAKRIGLVDEFGGIYDAINFAAGEAGIATEDVRIRFFPEPKDEGLYELLENLENMEQKEKQGRLQAQLMDIYHSLQTVGSSSSIQARLPYLIWIN